MENIKKEVYQPNLGANNRYENAKTLNPELAQQINQEALQVVNNAISVLEKVIKDPSMKNFHDKKTGNKWMGEWLIDQKKYIIQELYGAFQLNGISGIPREVENFVHDVYQTVEM